MRRGYLSAHFTGVAVKELAQVDIISGVSNQHEITGSRPLRRILGEEDRTFPRGGTDRRFPATYIRMTDEEEPLTAPGFLSWYDSRRGKPRAAEWRLYFQSNDITRSMQPGDALFLGRRPDDSLLFIIAPQDSTVANQLAWLFGLPRQPGLAFATRDYETEQPAELNLAARFILDELGIEPEEPEAELLDRLIERFGATFPTTREMSGLARQSLAGEVDARDDADEALVRWLEREEALFRGLERRIVSIRIEEGFLREGTVDVDGFISFSLSVQNRRKSRMGHSFENHLEEVFTSHGIRYRRGARTEKKARPDFLFPGEAEYHDPAFPSGLLTMLGAKSTCKDRWRQVLYEAQRIEAKHLATLEPGISRDQTDEMRDHRLQLVLPRSLHASYLKEQQADLLDLSGFLDLVQDRQKGCEAL